MPIAGQSGDIRGSRDPRARYGTTRRGLVAAAAVLAAAVATRKAHAFARPPRNHNNRRHGQHCFLKGTHIRTPNGEVKVESLAIGDLVATVDGKAKPIKWIGRRRLERGLGERWAADALPVKVARSAFGALVPHADLFLSPMHAVYVDGLLIPVRSLVNGRSIVHSEPYDVDVIEYFHIELAGHDVIFAEGAPAETLLASSDRAFDNWAEERNAPAPHIGVDQLEPYAPRVLASYKAVIHSRLRSAAAPWIDRRHPVDVIWDRIAERAETKIAA